MTATDTLIWAVVIHLVCDWLLQNDWQARNKANLRHPAGYVHAGIHLAGLLLVVPPAWALLLSVSHLLIDTRIPLIWWCGFFGQTRDGPAGLHVAIWTDQVVHIACLALVALAVGVR